MLRIIASCERISLKMRANFETGKQINEMFMLSKDLWAGTGDSLRCNGLGKNGGRCIVPM